MDFELAASQSLPSYTGTPFHIVSTMLIGFQGLFIFLVYIIFSPNARKEWKRLILRMKEIIKERFKNSSTSSGAYSSQYQQTKQPTVPNYKRNQVRKKALGTIRPTAAVYLHQVHYNQQQKVTSRINQQL